MFDDIGPAVFLGLARGLLEGIKGSDRSALNRMRDNFQASMKQQQELNKKLGVAVLEHQQSEPYIIED